MGDLGQPAQEYYDYDPAEIWGRGADGLFGEGLPPGPTVDPLTGYEVGAFYVDPNGNAMIMPVGGSMGPFPPGSTSPDTHTFYPNGSNYHRLNPFGHPNNPDPHGHGHLLGTGPFTKGQGPSIDTSGNIVDFWEAAAHWLIKK